MRALTLTSTGLSLRTDWPVPSPPDGDVLARPPRGHGLAALERASAPGVLKVLLDVQPS